MIEAAHEPEPPRRVPLRLTPSDAAVCVLALVLSGCGSLWLGQDLNFDLLSYHYYNGYAFVFGRLDRDIAPTGWHTYISPAMDALLYLAMVDLPPRVFGFLLGAVHGLNVVAVYLLGLCALQQAPSGQARILAGIAAALAALGPNAVSLLGTTMGNNLVSLPILAALLVLSWPRAGGDPASAAGPWSRRRLLAASALCGVASGLRLTAAVDHLAVALVVLSLAAARSRSARAALSAGGALAVGSLLGFLAVNGLWSARLLERFGNPLFPFANQVFRSPFFAPEFLRDTRWLARDAWDYLRPPLDLALGRTERLQEIGAREARYLVLAACGVAAAALSLARRRASGPGAAPEPAARAALVPTRTLLSSYWLVAYVLWAAAFYYYRYMTTLELVAPLVLVLLLRSLVKPAVLVPAVLALSVGLAAWSRTDSWGRGDWRASWFGLSLPQRAQRSEALVLLAGAPVSFALPDFPADARFVHLTAIREKGGSELFDRMIARALEEHRGPLLLLASFRVDKDAQDPSTRRPRWSYNPEEDVGPAAARFGIALTDRCDDMRTRRGRLYLCEVERTADAAEKWQDAGRGGP